MRFKEKDNVLDVNAFFDSLKNSPRDAEKCIEFFLMLQRQPANAPKPFLELITIIKVEKPLLYIQLKERLQANRRFPCCSI